MGLLALDVTRVGIVMSSDSQDVLLTEGRCLPVGVGHRAKDKIITVRCAAFSALVGYVGTERIGDVETRRWLTEFVARHASATGFAHFCAALGEELSAAWEEGGLDSCMWVFVAGYEDGEARFWYVVNAIGIDELGCYTGVSRSFRVVNDLDETYMPEHLGRGFTKAQVLDQISFHFRNGAIFPGALIFDAFSQMIADIVRLGPPGFGPRCFDLERYAYVARQRMEFLKRLYSPKHGIYSPITVPLIEGKVYVYSLAPTGEFTAAPKQRSQARPV